MTRAWTRMLGAAILIALVLPARGGAADKAVLQVIGVKLKGDLDTYLQKVKGAQPIAKRLGTPAPRVWRSTIAGPDTGTIFVAVEHKSMAALVEAQGKLSADSEWQNFMKDLDKSGLRTVESNSILEDETVRGGSTSRSWSDLPIRPP
jgi:hypothetical protein